MDKAGKLNILKNVPELVLIFVISSSIVVSLSRTLDVNRSIIWLLSAIAVFIIFYCIVMINKTSLIITAIVSFLTLLVVFLNSRLRKGLQELFAEIPEFTAWILEYASGTASYEESYANVLLIIVISITVFFTLLFTLKYFNFYIVLFSGMTFFVIQYIYGFLLNYTCFYSFIASMLVYYILHVHRKFAGYSPNEYASRTKVFFWSVPISALIVTVALAFPHNSGPIKWDWMDTKINKLMDFWANIRQRHVSFDYFSVASSGFGDSGRLGGKVRTDDTQVLSVESKYPLYLKGIAASLYSNNRWQDMKSFNNDDIGIEPILRDTKEFQESLSLLAGTDELPPGIIEQRRVSITFEDLRTKSLFIPSKLTSIDFGGHEIDLLCSPHGVISADTVLSKGFNYKLEYLHINYSELSKLLRKSTKRIPISVNPGKQDERYNKKADTAEQNFENCLQVPEEFPERIGQLAWAITVYYDNDYDKVKAIERYLSNNYLYTLEPPPTPPERDFVDFFLFDGKQGYCTYFATAMTMMVRTLGFHSRYVEGYVLPSEPAEDGSERYIVTNRNAHAWTEVYFEEAGWIPFEPTSPFTASFYRNHAISDSQTFSAPGDPYFYEEFMDEYELYDELPFSESAIIRKDKDSRMHDYIPLIIIMGSSVCLISLLIAFNTIKYKINLNRIKKSDPRQAILKSFTYYFKLLALAGYTPAQGETVSEYADRLDKYIILPKEPVGNSKQSFSNSIIKIAGDTSNKKSEIKRLFEIFILARYSKHPVTEKEKTYVLSFLPFFITEAKKEGKLKFYLLRFIRGSI